MKPLAITIDNEFRTVALKTLMLAIALLFAGFVSNASARGVSTRLDKEANMQPGNYSVVAYGCNGSADPRAVAFLQRDDVPYHVSVAEPRAQVQTVSGLTSDEAYRRAE